MFCSNNGLGHMNPFPPSNHRCGRERASKHLLTELLENIFCFQIWQITELNIKKNLFQPKYGCLRKRVTERKRKYLKDTDSRLLKPKITANKDFKVGEKVHIF
ncbi:hypothetical protein NGRA_1538 [Nosema granulosis]|uniref:Uncharacterized protein n=1 Tax=Nosema granulosis TaxID=83296 RepID=A0A9P6GZ93_9MICR|nr:hypothetical protein NGRA_1538 [Nosema granulosis]